MNILFVGRSFFRGGGSATRLQSIVEPLSRRHRVFVLTIVPKDQSVHSQIGKNVWVLHCPINPKFTIIPFMSLVNVFLTFFYLRSVLRKLRVDIVVASIPEFEEGIATTWGSKGSGARNIIDVGDLIVDDHVAVVYRMFPKLFRSIFKYVLRTLLTNSINSYDEAVTVTPTLKRAMIREGIRVPIHVITNGADTTMFRPASVESKLQTRKELGLDGNFLILYAGAMGVDYYPMEVIFDAFEIVAESLPDARLILCGSWNHRVEHAASKLKDRVKYLGFLKLSTMAQVMQACDLGLITMDERPSTFVAFTTKFFEYLASGLPVIAAVPRGGELDKLIKSEFVGYAIAPLDYRSMAERIIHLLRNTDERQMLARKGVELVNTRFDRLKLAEDFQEILLKSKA